MQQGRASYIRRKQMWLNTGDFKSLQADSSEHEDEDCPDRDSNDEHHDDHQRDHERAVLLFCLRELEREEWQLKEEYRQSELEARRLP